MGNVNAISVTVHAHRQSQTQTVFKETIDLNKHPELIEEARLILKKCNGLPLAIATIGGFLANQPKTAMEWRKLNEHISAELEMNPELEAIRSILSKSYDGLPYHLKSCFLYLSIFPEDYKVSRRRLTRRWTVEGYSRNIREKSADEIADTYFMELIDRSMILQSQQSARSRKGIDSCQVHDLMREISISKSTEESLVFTLEECCTSNTQGTVRHLSVSRNWKGDESEFVSVVDLSRIRSLTVFGNWRPFFISDKMWVLRVLDCEVLAELSNLESLLVQSNGEPGLQDCLDGLSSPPKKLQSLKLYGNLVKLPEWINGFHNLVKLTLRNSMILELDATIQVFGKLRNLASLRLWAKSFQGNDIRFNFYPETFLSLTVLELNSIDGLKSVKFEEGAMLKLELLDYCGSSEESNTGLFSGLRFIPKLKVFRLDSKTDYKDDFMVYLQAQLAKNPNGPVLRRYEPTRPCTGNLLKVIPLIPVPSLCV
ncbi:hypothetical protein HU200_015788 [Digitaria exilis]|uniref:NB-ARC domain-containing protein n=1 Tax=Digitaria exilis TaxID=1010633 RepID=A0A835KIT4_9POAL|nr:hypothetical protein HU200_015788 [Digitaria exilis]